MPCKVCSDHSSGKHYGIFACDGCAGFFKRSIRRSRNYVCKAKSEGKCVVDKTHRNQCRACRLRKCIKVGMNKDAVQHERGPRNSTLRRQMAMFMNKDMIGGEDVKSLQQEMVLRSLPMRPAPMPPYILDLSVRNRSVVEQTVYPTPMMTHFPLIASPSDAQFEWISETAAELLLRNTRWLKGQCLAARLTKADQLTLLENSWCDLFILSATKYFLHMNPLLCAYKLVDNVKNPSEKYSQILNEAQIFQSLLFKLAHLCIDDREYDCLQAIILYNMESNRADGGSEVNKERVQESSKIASLQNDAITDLATHLNCTKPTQPMRYKTLMMLLEQFKEVSSQTIHELFFQRVQVSIQKVIHGMYSQDIIWAKDDRFAGMQRPACDTYLQTTDGTIHWFFFAEVFKETTVEIFIKTKNLFDLSWTLNDMDLRFQCIRSNTSSSSNGSQRFQFLFSFLFCSAFDTKTSFSQCLKIWSDRMTILSLFYYSLFGHSFFCCCSKSLKACIQNQNSKESAVQIGIYLLLFYETRSPVQSACANCNFNSHTVIPKPGRMGTHRTNADWMNACLVVADKEKTKKLNRGDYPQFWTIRSSDNGLVDVLYLLILSYSGALHTLTITNCVRIDIRTLAADRSSFPQRGNMKVNSDG